MKRLVLCISMGIICMGLCACEGTGFDPAALQEATQSIQEASQTIEQVTESLGEMEQYVGMIRDSMQQGVDSTNEFMDWYENEAIPENPWINPPITEEEVVNAIRAGEEGLMDYIAQNVDSNSSYDALSEEDMEFFTDYFADESVNGFLLSTYEKPEACDASEALSRYTGIIKETGKSDKDLGEGRISRKNADSVLGSVLGITSDELDDPLEFVERKDKQYYYVDEIKPCEDLVCDGGYYYNNMYVVFMRERDEDAPYALTVLSKEDDGSVKIHVNFWSKDMDDVTDWSGSFVNELYDKMLSSDLKAVMSIPGRGGDITLGSALDAVGGLKGKDIDKALELVSGEKDKVKTYIQEFDGYDVYYSNLDPEAVGEFVVSQIDVTEGDFKTAEGIGIGTGIDTLKETYGEGIEAMTSGGRKQLMYEMGKYNMLFMIDKAGKVSEMTIFLADNAFSE